MFDDFPMYQLYNNCDQRINQSGIGTLSFGLHLVWTSNKNTFWLYVAPYFTFSEIVVPGREDRPFLWKQQAISGNWSHVGFEVPVFFSGVPTIGNVTRRSVDNWSQNDEKTFALEEVRKAWYIHETLGSHCDCYAGAELKIGWKLAEKLPCLGLVLSPNILIIGVMGLATRPFSHEAYKACDT